MDAHRFDALTRSLTTARSRRRALALAALFAPLLAWERAGAHDKRKRCKKLEGDKKKECLRKAKKHNKKHAADTQPPGGGTTTPPPPPPFCAGKNVCADGTFAARCDGGSGGSPTCFCWVRAGTGEPFCGGSADGNPCDLCSGTEVCVVSTGCGEGALPTGCAEPCPNPCVQSAGSCTLDTECCGFMVCSGGKCSCAESGDECGVDGDCCPGLICIDPGVPGNPARCIDPTP